MVGGGSLVACLPACSSDPLLRCGLADMVHEVEVIGALIDGADGQVMFDDIDGLLQPWRCSVGSWCIMWGQWLCQNLSFTNTCIEGMGSPECLNEILAVPSLLTI